MPSTPGARLMRARRWLRLSRHDVADKVGVDIAVLAAVEKGEQPPSRELVQLLSALYRRPVVWILDGTSTPVPTEQIEQAGLSDHDRKIVADFAGMLAGR